LPNRRPERNSRARIAAACLVPVGWVAFLVGKLSVNVPFSDEWELVPLLRKQAARSLRWADVWAQHNEHRSFFPELIMLKVARFTHWNIRAEVLVNLVLAAMTLAVLLFLLKRTLGLLGRGPYAVAAVLFSWMMFSPRQWENWLWGWQMAWFLSNLSAVVAAAVLSQWPDRRPSWLGLAFAATGATPVNSNAGNAMKLPPPATALSAPPKTPAANRKIACGRVKSAFYHEFAGALHFALHSGGHEL